MGTVGTGGTEVLPTGNGREDCGSRSDGRNDEGGSLRAWAHPLKSVPSRCLSSDNLLRHERGRMLLRT